MTLTTCSALRCALSSLSGLGLGLGLALGLGRVARGAWSTNGSPVRGGDGEAAQVREVVAAREYAELEEEPRLVRGRLGVGLGLGGDPDPIPDPIPNPDLPLGPRREE